MVEGNRRQRRHYGDQATIVVGLRFLRDSHEEGVQHTSPLLVTVLAHLDFEEAYVPELARRGANVPEIPAILDVAERVDVDPLAGEGFDDPEHLRVEVLVVVAVAVHVVEIDQLSRDLVVALGSGDDAWLVFQAFHHAAPALRCATAARRSLSTAAGSEFRYLFISSRVTSTFLPLLSAAISSRAISISNLERLTPN